MRTRIIYEDKDLLICHKPAGLAVQSARISEPDMCSELKNYLAGGYLGVVHRLDQPVSGILVFAKNKRAAAELSRQVAEHEIEKTYRAAVYARETADLKAGDQGELDGYMVKLPGGGARLASKDEPGAKRAQLQYRCLRREADRALLEIDLKTGRHHQIRVQMAGAGLPLLGDQRYGTQESCACAQRFGIRNVQLQAVRLALKHSGTGKKVCYELDEKLDL